MSSFCTNLRRAECSHRRTMLRFRSLASHNISSIISNFYDEEKGSNRPIGTKNFQRTPKIPIAPNAPKMVAPWQG